MKTAPQTKKPVIDTLRAIQFASGEVKTEKVDKPQKKQKSSSKGLSGKVPEGDVRLTCNIKADIHLKLKIAAATRQAELGKAFTVGELIEELAQRYIK